MVAKGLSDLVVIIGEERVKSVKNILMSGNEVFRKMLEDDKFDGNLVLCEGSSVVGFVEMCKYYSGGCMELNDENVMEVLLMSIYYKDKEIYKICTQYFKYHLNDEMMMRMLELGDFFVEEEKNEILEIMQMFFKENGSMYLKDERMLLKLRIENLKIILENDDLIIEDDNWLFIALMRWYKHEKNRMTNEEENKKFDDEFRSLVIKSIHIDKLRIDEMEEEILNELDNIKMSDYLKEMKKKKEYKYYKSEIIKDKRVEEIILKYYKNEYEDTISEKDLRIIKNENVISMLLTNENIKMKMIGLMIINESRIDYKSIKYNKYSCIVSEHLKQEILLNLIKEYKVGVSNRIIKCLCMFVNDYKYINVMKILCGYRILYTILNYDCFYSKASKELIKKYILEYKLSVEEEEEMSKIILDAEVLEELKTKEIKSFSYPQLEYFIGMNEKISIIPSFDGNRVEFSISPSLPFGMLIDKETGIINGKVDRMYKKRGYEVKCKNIRSEKKIKISLEFGIKFTELNKSYGISILNNGKTITNMYCGDSHCYLDLKIERGVYHIKYRFYQNGCSYDDIMLGLSKNNTYFGNNIYNQSTTCNYLAYDGESQDITHLCHIGTVVNSNPNFNNQGDGSIYEIIVDMNKREFWISHNNSSPVLLVKDLPSPLYPYANLGPMTFIELLSVSHED